MEISDRFLFFLKNPKEIPTYVYGRSLVMAIMKTAPDEVISEMTKILKKVYADRNLCIRMSEHICVILQGLTNLSFSGCISKSIVEDEFAIGLTCNEYGILIDNKYCRASSELTVASVYRLIGFNGVILVILCIDA